MKLAWVEWAGGILTRDDGYRIYKDLRWAILVRPNGERVKCRTVNEAKEKAK